MRKLFFLLLTCSSVIGVQAQTYTSGLTATGSGGATNVRLGGANPLLVNTTVDLGTSFTFGFKKSTANYFTVLNNGNIGIGTITPTSLLHLKAGTAAVNTAPLKFTSGVNLTTPEAGVMEFNGTSLFFTPTTSRKEIGFADLSNITGLLPATLGGTGLASFATGDMLYASAANVLGKRTIGTTGQVLTVVSGVPAWATPAAGTSGWALTGNTATVPGTNFIGTSDAQRLVFKTNNIEQATILSNGNVGIGNTAPTSLLHLKAGTAALNTAPLKFTSGTILTTPEAGAMEFNGTSLFFTPSASRKEIAFADLSNITGALPTSKGGTGLATVGTNNQVLTIVAGVPAWATPAAGASGWGLSGNAGTVAGTNFIGTTDNIDVVFKRNGVNSGLINSSNTGFGVSSLALNTTGINNTATGAGAMASNTIGFDNVASGTAALNANTSGHTNVATGSVALLSNTTGISNTAIGAQALAFNLTGNYNVGTGRGSLLNNNSGSDNVATGLQSLYNNSTGSNNVASGSYALHANTTGSNNTAIGYRSNVSVGSLTNATAIGNYALVSQSNSLILGSIAGVNGAAASTTVGIGNNAPTERLDVTGNLKFSGALMPNNAAGTTGQVLTSNGAGAAPTWGTPAAVVSGWALAGNSATVPGTNFIGTTDAQRLVFKTNNVEQATILSNGNVGIGTVTPAEKLDVAGNIYTNGKVLIGTSGLATGTHLLAVNGSAIFTKAVVRLTGVWPDYVFKPSYNLPSLNEVEIFLQKHNHLPDVPSAAEVEKNGIDLGDNQAILLKKIEELTLYMIELNKKVEIISKENELLQKKVNSNNK